MQEFQKATMKNYMNMKIFYDDMEKTKKNMKKQQNTITNN